MNTIAKCHIYKETEKGIQINDTNIAIGNIFDILVRYDIAKMTLHSPAPLLNSLFQFVLVSPRQRVCAHRQDRLQNSKYPNINHQYS
jgi:hypothetical protein